jgi:hypothetical protein
LAVLWNWTGVIEVATGLTAGGGALSVVRYHQLDRGPVTWAYDAMIRDQGITGHLSRWLMGEAEVSCKIKAPPKEW